MKKLELRDGGITLEVENHADKDGNKTRSVTRKRRNNYGVLLNIGVFIEYKYMK